MWTEKPVAKAEPMTSFMYEFGDRRSGSQSLFSFNSPPTNHCAEKTRHFENDVAYV